MLNIADIVLFRKLQKPGIVRKYALHGTILIVQTFFCHTRISLYVRKVISNICPAHYEANIFNMVKVCPFKIPPPIKRDIAPFNDQILPVLYSGFYDFTDNGP